MGPPPPPLSPRKVTKIDENRSTISSELASLYNADYYASHLGGPYRWDNRVWQTFFGRIADALVQHVEPRSVLDAGCALGFLVAALRDRRVEAYGIDISDFIIGEVPPHVRPYCSVGSITEPLNRHYDLIVCIEVLEHLSPEDAEPVISNLCDHAERVLFSSTPSDEVEATHLNVRPVSYWARLFADRGFFRDGAFDAAVVATHACLFVRRAPNLGEVAAVYEELYVESRLRQAELERKATAATTLAVTQAERIVVLEAALREWEGIRERSGWRIYNALFNLRVRVAPPGSVRNRALRRALRSVVRGLEIGRRTQVPFGAEAGPTRKAVLFLSGCPGDAKRYRTDHQAEQFGVLGGTADTALIDEVPPLDVLDRYRCLVLHRVAWDLSLERFLQEARRRGLRVLFDTDDLVFDPDALPHVAALDKAGDDVRALYLDGVRRYRQTLASTDGVTVSTDALAEEARRVNGTVEVSYNVASVEMTLLADAARSESPRTNAPTFTAAYLSGTPTHSRDFTEVIDPLLRMLEEYPQMRFVAVGHLELDERFGRFRDRVKRLPLQPWRELPRVLADIGVNLAPLEPHNPFTDAKSCIKYIEAGLVGVPTIASPRPDFVRAIRHGDNGLLAETPEQWYAALKTLVESDRVRREMGRRAYDDVRRAHTSAAGARRLYSTLSRLGRTATDKPLEISWLVGAPLRQTGGHSTIFRLASLLAERGHRSRMYVEPAAHLNGMSQAELQAFLVERFGPLPFDLRVGYDSLEPADVSLATNWSTAAVVAEHRESLFKAYLVQDYEASLYDSNHPLRDAVRASYELPLRHVCYGLDLAQELERKTARPADPLDFALDPDFRIVTPPGKRGGSPRLLFCAKPEQTGGGFAVGAAALGLLQRQAPEVEIVLFGCSDEELGELPFRHRNLGQPAMGELAAAMNEAHVFLSLSLANISDAPYEAMACGCAVVEARMPAGRASLRDGVNCLLAEPDAVPLADALLRLAQDDELRVRLASRAAEDVAEMSWDQTGRQLEELLLDAAFVRLASV